VIKKVVSREGYLLEFASEKLRDDEEIVRISLSNNPNIFRKISNRLKDNDDIALKAITVNGFDYSLISDRLKNRPDFARIALIKYPHNFEIIPEKIRNDESFLRAAIEKNGDIMMYAPAKLKDDKALALKAIAAAKTVSTVSDLSKRLLDDDEVFRAAMLKNQTFFRYFSTRIQNDKALISWFLNHCQYVVMCFDSLPLAMQQNPEILNLKSGIYQKENNQARVRAY
jgi:hypothetical protein